MQFTNILYLWNKYGLLTQLLQKIIQKTQSNLSKYLFHIGDLHQQKKRV